MEVIPFIIFAFIAFNLFRDFKKATPSKSGKTAKEMMRQLNEQMQQASKGQGSTPNIREYAEKGPTARGRERMALRNQNSSQNSPWDHDHDLGGGPLSPGAKVAAEYLKKAQAARRAAESEWPSSLTMDMAFFRNWNSYDKTMDQGGRREAPSKRVPPPISMAATFSPRTRSV